MHTLTVLVKDMTALAKVTTSTVRESSAWRASRAHAVRLVVTLIRRL